MKTTLMTLILVAIFSLSLMAQTRGIKLDDYRTIWYDSLYSTRLSQTMDLEMKYPDVSIVLVNKSATITDSLKLFSVTKGYSTIRPYSTIDFSISAMWLKNSAGESVSSDEVIVLAPNTTKEYIIANFTLHLLETRLLNTNVNAKAYYYIRGVKQVSDK